MKKRSLKRKSGLQRSGLTRRSGLQRLPHSLKRPPIKRIAPEFNKEQHSKDWEFYNSLWDNHPTKKCDSCSVQLWGENLSLYHDHLIEKSVRPDLRYEPKNMALVCTNCHSSKSMGNPTKEHLELINRAKELFMDK